MPTGSITLCCRIPFPKNPELKIDIDREHAAALGLGAGAESRRPLGLAVVGGLFFSQIITLYVTPVFYTYFDELQRLVRWRLGRLG